jgi:hypothetical protein
MVPAGKCYTGNNADTKQKFAVISENKGIINERLRTRISNIYKQYKPCCAFLLLSQRNTTADLLRRDKASGITRRTFSRLQNVSSLEC